MSNRKRAIQATSIALLSILAASSIPTRAIESTTIPKSPSNSSYIAQNQTAEDLFKSTRDKSEARDYQGALADYNKAIELEPKNSLWYNGRAYLKRMHLQDYQGALADFNKAISLDNEFALAYQNRGILKAKYLKNPKGAIADLRQAVKLFRTYGEKLPDAEYFKPASFFLQESLVALKKLGVNEEAPAATTKSPADSGNVAQNKSATEFYLDGQKKQKAGDFQGALADFSKAIELKPQDTLYHFARAALRIFDLKDNAGGIADLRQTAKLARAQSDTRVLEMSLTALKQLGVSE